MKSLFIRWPVRFRFTYRWWFQWYDYGFPASG